METDNKDTIEEQTLKQFFPYSDNLLNNIDVSNGNLIITFDNKVTGYSCMEEFNNEVKTTVYRINAWTTTWDLYLSNRGKQNNTAKTGFNAVFLIHLSCPCYTYNSTVVIEK